MQTLLLFWLNLECLVQKGILNLECLVQKGILIKKWLSIHPSNKKWWNLNDLNDLMVENSTIEIMYSCTMWKIKCNLVISCWQVMNTDLTLFLQELVAVIPSQQNLKGIGISVVVISLVLGLVSLSVFLMTPPYTGPRVAGVRMSLHNFTSNIFSANKFNATWISG